MFVLEYLIVLVIIGHTESKDRRRKPPPVDVEKRNETETFFSKVLSSHIRYCTNGRVCEHRRQKACYMCEDCYCDDACFLYGDCCPDVGLKEALREQEFECITSLVDSMYPPDVLSLKVDQNEKYSMISSCPSSDPDMKRLCSNSGTLPVTDVDNVITFRNKECALCHNVTEIRQWQISIQCERYVTDAFTSRDELVSIAINNPNCSVKFQAPEGASKRLCFMDSSTISRCNVTGLWNQYDEFVERACHSYQTVKIVANVSYNNPFCFICNTDNPDLLFTQSPCKRSGNIFTPSFTALLDFSDILRDSDEVRKAECAKGSIYDPDKKECRKLFCSYGRELRNDTCQSILGKSRGTAYRIYFTLNLNEKIPLKGPEDLINDLPASLASYFGFNLFDSKVARHGVTFAYNTTSAFGNCSDYTKQIFFSAYLITVKDVYQDEFEEKLLSIRNISFDFWNGERHFNFTTSVINEVARTLQSTSKVKSDSCTTSISVSSDAAVVEDLTYTPVNGLLMCPQIIIAPDEFRVDEAKGLVVDWSSVPIHPDDFEIQRDNHARICLNNFKPNAQGSLDGSLVKSTTFAEFVVSVVCTSLSMFCLLVSFVIYCVFKSLRSTPGRNNMNLIVALFIAQMMYLVGAGRTEVKGICEALGIFIHYFWLAAFCAMNVCSFHMFRVFTSMRSREDSSDMRRKVLQYSVYIYGMPAVLVTITLVSHIVATDGATTGYGGKVCYLSSALAILVAFGIPVAITIISNTIFFIITLRSIKNRPKIDKSKQDEHHAAVYIKLSTLTGITWTIGFVAILTGVQVLSYIFIFVNASQGVFLFISFVCNARVKKLIFQGGQDSYSGSHSRVGTKTNTAVTAVSVVANSEINKGKNT